MTAAGSNTFTGQNTFAGPATFSTIQSHAFRFNAAVNRTKNVSAIEFQPVNNTVMFTPGASGIWPSQSNTSLEAIARVTLPNDVDITGFQVAARDGSASANIQVALLIAEELNSFTSLIVPPSGTYLTSGSANVVLTQTTIFPTPLRYNDTQNMYFVRVVVPNTAPLFTPDAALVAVRLLYTQRALTP